MQYKNNYFHSLANTMTPLDEEILFIKLIELKSITVVTGNFQLSRSLVSKKLPPGRATGYATT